MTEAAVSMRRPPGKWVVPFHLMQMIALPLMVGCYLGVAEAMRDRVVAMAAKRADTSDWWISLERWKTNSPAHGSRTATWWGRRYAQTRLRHVEPHFHRSHSGGTRGSACRRTCHGALAAAFLYRAGGLERLFRDIQGVRYHRPQERMQFGTVASWRSAGNPEASTADQCAT